MMVVIVWCAREDDWFLSGCTVTQRRPMSDSDVRYVQVCRHRHLALAPLACGRSYPKRCGRPCSRLLLCLKVRHQSNIYLIHLSLRRRLKAAADIIALPPDLSAYAATFSTILCGSIQVQFGRHTCSGMCRETQVFLQPHRNGCFQAPFNRRCYCLSERGLACWWDRRQPCPLFVWRPPRAMSWLAAVQLLSPAMPPLQQILRRILQSPAS